VEASDMGTQAETEKRKEPMKHILRCHDFVKNDIIRGENCYLYDKNNKRYVDFESGIWCTVVGHANPRINRRIVDQISKVTHLGYRFTNYLAEEAATSLLDTISEIDGKCIFLCSGSEAVEFGINVAKLFTGRKLFLTLSESYLGAYGSAGMKGDGWVKIDLAKCSHCRENECLRECMSLKEIRFDRIGAFVFEPGSSSGKVKFPPEKLISLLVKEVGNFGGLILVNEVTTSFGRTGKWYGFNHYNIKPDIIAFGKGLGNGYPVSAVAMKKEIATELENNKFRYVQSHQNDPLGCAVASEVIRIIREGDLVTRSHKLGSQLTNLLTELQNRFPFIKEVRSRGLMIGMEFSKPQNDFNVELVFNEMLKRGFVIGYNPDADLIRFLPPLTIEEGEIEAVAKNLNIVLEKLSKNPQDD
jgi:acetylornithine/N-succinyldiaminopimelate aminotransferase